MKRIGYIICIMILGFFVYILTFFSPLIKSTNNNKGREIEKTEFFKITRLNSGYYYYIYDKNHNIVKSDGPLNKKPNIKLVEDNLIRFILQTGTGKATQWGYFYDIEENKFSSIFKSIYDQDNNLVIYGGPNKLIISDIFDETQYYKEISVFSRPLSKTADSIIDAEFVKYNNIKVSYLTGDDFEVVTENVLLFE